MLHASPNSGTAPLTVTFSLLTDFQTTHVSFDADGNGEIDYNSPQLNKQIFTFTDPGVYVAIGTAFDAQGNQFGADAIIQVFDSSQLDIILKAKWLAMKDALRVGNIELALNEIVTRSRSRYEEAFQIIATQLPNIDQILPNISVGSHWESLGSLRSIRIDDGLGMSFEVRFAIDGDGIWRMETF